MENYETGGGATGDDAQYSSNDECQKRYHTAYAYAANGFSVIPLGWNKVPSIEWKKYQNEIADNATLKEWFLEKKFPGIGIVCGSISGNLSILDFESNTIYLEWLEKAQLEGHGDILDRSVFVLSGKGVHAYFRLAAVPAAGRKLAFGFDESGKKNLLIETRASGNYVMTPGSAAWCHPNRIEYAVMRPEFHIKDTLTINEDTWYAFTTIAESFNEIPANEDEATVRTISKSFVDNSVSPTVQDFNENCDIEKLLKETGFKLERTDGGKSFWQKPHSSNPGYHCTFNHEGSGRLFNFSAANEPLEENRSYSPFEVLALFQFDGDEFAAEMAIRDEGYGTDYWEDPEEIIHVLPAISQMQLGLLPDALRGRISDVSYRMQVPMEAVACAHLITIAAVIGAGCAIRPKQHDSWQVVPNLWGYHVARPGFLKSPNRKEATKFLKPLEKEAEKRFKVEWAEYENELEVYKLKVDRLKVAAKKSKADTSAEDLRAALNAIPKPEEPKQRRYKSNEVSTQKMTELLEANQRGLLVETDELASFLARMEQKEHQTDKGYFLQAWDGDGDYSDDKIGRGTTKAAHLCLSWLGCIQPDKLKAILKRTQHSLGNDGMIQRYQMSVWPDEQAFKVVDEEPDLMGESRLQTIIQRLHDIDFTAIGAEKDKEDGIPFFRFQAVAQTAFYSWLQRNAAKVRADANPLMQEHLQKYQSLLPSLALIFHLVERLDPARDHEDVSSKHTASAVSLDNLKLAEQWCDLLESHARRIYSLLDLKVKDATDFLAKKLQEGLLEDGFSLRDIDRKKWHGLTDRQDVKAAIEELKNANWIFEVKRPARWQQKSSVTYRINPKIKGNSE
jgi:hypothetical protein